MQIKDMFEKQIDRDIKGVIKVGQSDEENVYQELDEYVVTKELLKHFRDFFDNYEKGINNANKDFKIIEFDLFHTMIQVLEEEGYLEAFFDLEKDNGFFDMAESLVETLGLDETDDLNLIITKILQEDLTDSVVFLTGVGKCHPIISSHNILNNLHQVLDSVPVVMFYPGEYSGQDLKLFGTMDSRNYYRAFRLV